MEQPRRILLIDGTPGPATILVLAAYGAIKRIDNMLIPDTRWYTTAAYAYLDRLAGIATRNGIETVWIDQAADPAATVDAGSALGRLPLHTKSSDGTQGQMPNRCAASQAAAIDATVQKLTNCATHRSKRSELAEILHGIPVEQADHAAPNPTHYRHRFPLVELGWRTEDCRAHLAMHNLAFAPDMACIACPNRSTAGWAELRATDPQAWHEAVAVDAALRHRASTAASSGMPPGTTSYLHPARTPLTEVDLDTAIDAGSEGCLPRACRGTSFPPMAQDGGAA